MAVIKFTGYEKYLMKQAEIKLVDLDDYKEGLSNDGGSGDFTDLTEENIKIVMNFFDRTPYTT
jgi:hypothetical protein